MNDSTSQTPGEAALTYARRGWPVLPLHAAASAWVVIPSPGPAPYPPPGSVLPCRAPSVRWHLDDRPADDHLYSIYHACAQCCLPHLWCRCSPMEGRP